MGNNPSQTALVLLLLQAFLGLTEFCHCFPQSVMDELWPALESSSPTDTQLPHSYYEPYGHYPKMSPFYPPCPFFPPPAPPSYCIQSVVVGDRDNSKKKEASLALKKPGGRAGSHPFPPIHPFQRPYPCPDRLRSRPSRGGILNAPSSRYHRTECNPLRLRAPLPTSSPLHHRKSSRDKIERYEEYLEKMLELLRERLNKSEESPVVVVTPKRKRKKRRKRKRYRLSSIEDSGSPELLEKSTQSDEDDEGEFGRSAIILNSKFKRGRRYGYEDEN